MKTIIAFVIVAALAGCDPSTSPDAGTTPPPPTSTCSAACGALAGAGCSIGSSAGCPAFLSTVEASHQQANPVTSRPVTCADVLAVKTKADAVKLGFVCQ